MFAFPQVKTVLHRQHTRVSPNQFTNVNINLNALKFVPGAVGTLAYGRVAAPSFLRADSTFGPVGTAAGLPPRVATENLHFNLQLPSGAKPADGWPVARIEMGAAQNKEVLPTQLAAKLPEAGIATLTINPFARGFGPLGTSTVTLLDNSAVTFLAGGRGRDVNGDGTLGANEGTASIAPCQLLDRRDPTWQTVIDHVAVARAVVELGAGRQGVASLIRCHGRPVGGDGPPPLFPHPQRFRGQLRRRPDGDDYVFLGHDLGSL